MKKGLTFPTKVCVHPTGFKTANPEKGDQASTPRGPCDKDSYRESRRGATLCEKSGMVPVCCSGTPVSAISSKDAHGVQMANSIAEVLPLESFAIRVFNRSRKECRLPNGMVLGHALPHPKGIVALVDEPLKKIADQRTMGIEWKKNRLHGWSEFWRTRAIIACPGPT
jgi:hypothetical protein